MSFFITFILINNSWLWVQVRIILNVSRTLELDKIKLYICVKFTLGEYFANTKLMQINKIRISHFRSHYHRIYSIKNEIILHNRMYIIAVSTRLIIIWK